MRKWLPLFSVALGAFVLLIDVSIVNVALPSMTADLHASFTGLQWVIDIYALVLAALLLGLGSMSDLIGRKPVYVGGLVVFALSSLAAGSASDTTTLIVARGVQGAGAAAMFATTIALLGSSYQGRDLGVAFGVWGAVNGAAAAAGPIIGGLLTQAISWRWVFYVNLPVSVLAVAVSARVLPREERASGGRIDLPGVLAFTLAAGAFTAALTRASDNGWTSASTLVLLGVGALGAIAFVWIESRSRRPVLDLALLRRGPLAGLLVTAALYSVAAFAYIAYESLWLQSVRGMSPVQTGLALMPLAFMAFVVSLATGKWLHAVPARWRIGAGMALIGLGALAQAQLDAQADWSALLPGLAITGLGVGLATGPLASAALATVPRDRGGMASGALNTARQLGYALGIAALGLVCKSAIADHLAGTPGIRSASAAARAISGGEAPVLLAKAQQHQRAELNHAIHAAFAHGLNTTLLAAAAAGLVAALIAVLALAPQRRPEVESAAAPAARSA
jgi:EmrB/QacA subfamily drug resistance transporter